MEHEKDAAAKIALAVAFAFCLTLNAIASVIIAHKAGLPRNRGFLFAFVPAFGPILAALAPWPIHDWLTIHRIRSGVNDTKSLEDAVAIASRSELEGDWEDAIEIFERVAVADPNGPNAEYAKNRAKEIRERIHTGSE